VAEFQNERLRGKSREQLIDELGDPVAQPGSIVWEMYRAAIDAKIADRQAEIAEREVEASMLHLEAARKGCRVVEGPGRSRCRRNGDLPDRARGGAVLATHRPKRQAPSS
jgi:hypothetical protein